ncbi:hypothetical protein EV284_1038 [Streptomyces sp. BK022]|uniref:hypothetical protein n=1 Tax=Streptomyces sp. BK022 TaxID=2512123 RepID=UPI0010DA268E|nr:hypothetical protein [Streptomyces sp. BK022]RZU46366.1 hypothetical protein EV284_1038 [Streptomyces sp. BK022]
MADTGGEGGTACVAAPGQDIPEALSGDPFTGVGAVADAVLYEGYLLYPYRRSSAKNRVRWQFGVLLPRAWVEADGPVAEGVSGSADSWYQRTECLVRATPDAVLRVRVRYLQLQRKQVEAPGEDGRYRPVESLRGDDGTAHLSFDEAVPYEVDLAWPLAELLHGPCTAEVSAPPAVDTGELGAAGRVVRRREHVQAHTTVGAEKLADGLYRLCVRTENAGEAADVRAPRGRALRQALLAAHTLLTGEGLEFVSQTDPPAALRERARGCRSAFTFPVLGGPAGQSADGATGPVVLSAPIILPDHPQVAPESPGDLHDAAEIDEILTLRTMLLTDEEKAEARATDPRAARILDRVDTMPPEVFANLHGAIRSLAPAAEPSGARPAWWQEGGDAGLSPTTDTVTVAGVPLGTGSRVRLNPRLRGADAQDMFLVGRTAEVAAVFHDVDGSVHLAVTVDDDPAAELHGWYGRFHYFRPDELEPLGDGAAPRP